VSDAARPGAGPMSAQLAGLYQELILDHYRRPRNRGTVEAADETVAMKNPICGDEITLTVAFDGDRVRDARFAGAGCSISQASASMMTQLVKGKTLAEVEVVKGRLIAMLKGDAEAAADERLGDLRALSGVARLPVRVKCAILAWSALERALAGRG
jgi:nitrogen fixation protein NifU and related proteins